MEASNKPETTNHSVTFPLFWLKAIRNFSAKDDPKHYLNGVAVGDGALVATDGHCLGAMLDDRFDGLPQVIIPNAAIDTLVRSTSGIVKDWKHYDPHTINVVMQWEQEECGEHTYDFSVSKKGTLALKIQEADLFTFAFVSEPGKYPEYRRVLLPDHRIAYGHPHFNLELINRFEKAAKELGAKYPSKVVHVTPKGEDGARVRLALTGVDAPFEGAIMPMLGETGYDQPAVFTPLEEFVYAMKARFVDDCVDHREMLKWRDPVWFNADKLSRMFHDYVAKGDKVGAANILMMLHKRGDTLLGANGTTPSGNTAMREAA